jgi:hypothetical protein
MSKIREEEKRLGEAQLMGFRGPRDPQPHKRKKKILEGLFFSKGKCWAFKARKDVGPVPKELELPQT